MLNKIKNLLYIIKNLSSEISALKYSVYSLNDNLNSLKTLVGKQISNQNKLCENILLKNIQDSEFKVFSQWGDDGIIQFLVNYLNIKNKTFIEFGVENYKEANTRFLLINNNWSGLIIDGSEENIKSVKSEDLYWQQNLQAKAAFVTKENINKLILDAEIKGKIGLLHIDIDGNDYWIWNEINVISPDIVIMEYNSVFGETNPWTIPYQKDFNRTKAHFSNLYFGSSLTSLCDLAKEKGYIFIGCNRAGNNAYFVKKIISQKLKPLTCKQGYVQSKFRESRDIQGNLTHISGLYRLATIKGLPIFNTKTNKIETIE